MKRLALWLSLLGPFLGCPDGQTSPAAQKREEPKAAATAAETPQPVEATAPADDLDYPSWYDKRVTHPAGARSFQIECAYKVNKERFAGYGSTPGGAALRDHKIGMICACIEDGLRRHGIRDATADDMNRTPADIFRARGRDEPIGVVAMERGCMAL